MASHSRSQRPPSLTSALISTLFVLPAFLSTPFTMAQTATPFKPVAVSGAAYARTTARLFVLGGTPAAGAQPTDQFMALDLFTNWNADSPPWTQLKPGPKMSKFPAVFSKDQTIFYAFHIPASLDPPISSAYQYNVKTGNWTLTNASAISGAVDGIGAVTNQMTGEIICAGGCTDPGRGKVHIWNPTATNGPLKTAEFPAPISPLPITGPAGVFQSRTFYANVWSAAAKGVLYFGGAGLVRPDSTVTVLNSTSFSITTLSTAGTPPPTMDSHCMAASDDGLTVIVYGGQTFANATVSGDVYILNLSNGAWTRSIAAGPKRINAVCTIAGDQFLAWGGVDEKGQVAGSTVSIFNYVSQQWVPQYIAPGTITEPLEPLITPPTATMTPKPPTSTGPSTAPPTTTSGTGSPGDGDKGGNKGAVIGGVLGGIILLALVAGYLYYRWRKQRQDQQMFGRKDRPDDNFAPAATTTPSTKDLDDYEGGEKSEFRSQRGNPQAKNIYTTRVGRDTGAEGHALTGRQQSQSRAPHAQGGADTAEAVAIGHAPARRHQSRSRAPHNVQVEGYTKKGEPQTTEDVDDTVEFEQGLQDLENQQKQLDLKRQLLVLQQQHGQRVPGRTSPQRPQLEHVESVSSNGRNSSRWPTPPIDTAGPQYVSQEAPLPPPPRPKGAKVRYPPPPTVQSYPERPSSSNYGYPYGQSGYADTESAHRGHNPQTFD